MQTQNTEISDISHAAIDDKAVAAYLHAHPDFFTKRSDLLDSMTLPNAGLEDYGVEDFQQKLIENLRNRLHNVREAAHDMVQVGRDNDLSMQQIHNCILLMLTPTTFDGLLRVVTEDIAQFLSLETITICVESRPVTKGAMRRMQFLSEGSVDALFAGSIKNVMIGQLKPDDPLANTRNLFGAESSLIRSAAFVRVNFIHEAKPTLMAFGSRDEGRFNADQSGDLLLFMARVFGLVLNSWLTR